MNRRFKFILTIAVLLGFLAGFIPSGRVQAYWLTNYVAETYGLGTKWDRGGYGGHAYWYRQYGGVYESSQSSWWSDYHGIVTYHYWSACPDCGAHGAQLFRDVIMAASYYYAEFPSCC